MQHTVSYITNLYNSMGCFVVFTIVFLQQRQSTARNLIILDKDPLTIS